MALTLHRYDDVDEFLRATAPFLAEREAEHNLIFGISSWLRRNPALVDEPPAFIAVSDPGGTIVAASIQTPPNNPVLSMVDQLEAVDLIADAYGSDVPGVLGSPEAAARFAARWVERSGGRAAVAMAERIFRLERVIPPRATTGAWRLFEPGDRDLVAEWMIAFVVEATPEDPPSLADARDAIDRWIRQEGTFGYLWDDRGEPASLAAARGETPNGIRIGPVYTPPEHRGQGYASAVTAAASQDQLDRGRRFVFLFTDLSNATSNKIYQAIGYEPVCDVDMYRFETDA
jgi:GNAT superfamily N-acetyltransferase